MEGSTVLVVDADGAARNRTAALLARLGCSVVTARSADEALVNVAARQPELVVLDVETGGLELCRELSELEIRVVLLSALNAKPCDAVAGLLAGADDFIAKPFDADELLARARRLLARPPAGTAARDVHLSQREVEVLQLLSQGRTQRQIATTLFISDKTVSTHVQHILTKLGVHSRAQAVAVAFGMGLVPAWPADLT